MAIAAALLEKAARLSAKHWRAAPAALERAGRLRLDAEELVEADVDAFLGYVEARRQVRALEGPAREAILSPAFELTVTVPLAIVQVATATVELATELGEHGNPNLHADAVTAAMLASSAGAAASRLVAVNLGNVAGDARAAEAQRLARSAKGRADRLARSSAASGDSPRPAPR